MQKRAVPGSIGLDLGQRYINLVELGPSEKTPQGLQLLDFASVSVGPAQGQEEKVKQLAQLAQRKETSPVPVNIGICGEAVIVRYIVLPRMNKEEIKEALKYEAQQYIPFKMEEVVFDYHLVETKDLEQNKMKILLVAAKKQAIMEFIGLLRQAGFKPKLIDVNAFSLINCFQFNGPQVKEEQVFALVNLGFDLVNISILQGERPFFFRDISLLEEFLSLRGGNSEQGLLELVRPLLANLIREIRLSIDYFESEFEKQVGTIYFSGEGARDAELMEFLGSQLGRAVTLWDPLQNLGLDSGRIEPQAVKETSPILALACGLALRGAK